MTASAEATQQLGPTVYIHSETSPYYKGLSIDEERLRTNLRRDFPEVSQEEWSTVSICFTDRIAHGIGGFSYNQLLHKSTLSQRAITKIFSFFTSTGGLIPNEYFKYFNTEHDVQVLVNIGATYSYGRHHASKYHFYTEDAPMTRDMILAHELHHTAGHLLTNRFYKANSKEVDNNTRAVAGYLGVLAATGATTLVGAVSEVYALAEGINESLAIEGGIVTSVGFLGFIGAVYAGHKLFKGDKGKVTYMKILQSSAEVYGRGEDEADAYAIATRKSWENVIQTN